jgi:hypothetical protein
MAASDGGHAMLIGVKSLDYLEHAQIGDSVAVNG